MIRWCSLVSRLLAVAAVTAVFAVLPACKTQVPDDVAEPPSGPFAQFPMGNEDPEAVFQAADAAYNRGDLIGAMREFGTLYLLAPQYRGGIAEQGLNATCALSGQRCEFPIGRLALMAAARAGAFGQMDAWLGRQRQDFEYILSCYERATGGDMAGAIAIANTVGDPPDEGFAYFQNTCRDVARTAESDARHQRRIDEAFVAWTTYSPCVDAQHARLIQTAAADDWERFVLEYATYHQCSSPLLNIIDSEILLGDTRLGYRYDLTWSNISEIDAVVEDNADRLERTVIGMQTLSGSSEHAEMLAWYQGLLSEEERALAAVAEYAQASAMLEGAARDGALAQMRAAEAHATQLRDQRQLVIQDINQLREQL
ncbi:MAG: hypothetical protein ACJA1R_002244, partial [Flavobacteriales bacterium]